MSECQKKGYFMENKQRDHWLYYADPDDPRLYLYKHPRHKWLGVTLNFSHPRAWPVFGITIGSVMPVVIFASVLEWMKSQGLDWMAGIAGAAFWVGMIVYVAVLCVHYFRAAERDLRQYGERRNME